MNFCILRLIFVFFIFCNSQIFSQAELGLKFGIKRSCIDTTPVSVLTNRYAFLTGNLFLGYSYFYSNFIFSGNVGLNLPYKKDIAYNDVDLLKGIPVFVVSGGLTVHEAASIFFDLRCGYEVFERIYTYFGANFSKKRLIYTYTPHKYGQYLGRISQKQEQHFFIISPYVGIEKRYEKLAVMAEIAYQRFPRKEYSVVSSLKSSSKTDFSFLLGFRYLI